MLKYHVTGSSWNEYALSIYAKINRHSKYLMPSYDSNDFDIDVVFWVDNYIVKCPTYSKLNYGWLTESIPVVPQVYEKFVNNFNEVIDNFNLIFTHSNELIEFHEKLKWIPASSTWIIDPQIYPKTKKLSIVTSAKNFVPGHSKRMETVARLQGSMDIYGHGFHSIEYKEDGLADYMFSIAHENANYSGYFTEKILDCFATGAIPIYWGDPDIGKVFNMDGIILLDDEFNPDMLTEDLYYSKMDAIKENLEIVKNNFMMVEDYIYQNYLKELDDNIL